MNKRILCAAVAVAGASALLSSAGISHAASGHDVIKARIDFMKDDIEDLWRPLAAYAKTGQGSLADVEKNASALAHVSKRLTAHFPKDTGRGHFPDDVTRALPVIWTDWDRFEKEAKRLVNGSEKLARLAREGNRDAVVTMIGASGSYAKTNIGCAECHQTFRGARVKR